MKKINLLFLCLAALLQGCGLLAGNQKIEKITFEYPSDATINYGHPFSLKTYAIYTNGKRKNITGKKDLSVTVKGGEYKNGVVRVMAYPESPTSDSIYAVAGYMINNELFEVKEYIPYNYNGDLTIKFVGETGDSGPDGSKGGSAILFRDGNDGDDGEVGSNGQNGHDLTVSVWKEDNSDRYQVKVTNITNGKTYFYTYKNNGYGLRFNVNGGAGGKGGNGGDGGNGKDGVIKEKKTKSPGDGGNGGNGGQGGNGGTGGSVYVFLHPNAIEIKQKIVVYNFGGNGGQPGIGGDAGEPGDPASGQENAMEGTAGARGITGIQGEAGPPFEIVVEEFDF